MAGHPVVRLHGPLEVAPAASGHAIVAGAPIVTRSPPLPNDPPLHEHALQGGVE
jgi:hypothetical protein